jgi:hypothetical protein
MTPNETARKANRAFKLFDAVEETVPALKSAGHDARRKLLDKIDLAITNAILEEREACAQMVEAMQVGLADYSPDVQEEIVSKIRARGNKD